MNRRRIIGYVIYLGVFSFTIGYKILLYIVDILLLFPIVIRKAELLIDAEPALHLKIINSHSH